MNLGMSLADSGELISIPCFFDKFESNSLVPTDQDFTPTGNHKYMVSYTPRY